MDEIDDSRTSSRASSWEPLEATVPADELAEWKYVGTAVRGARVIRQYKHQQGRRCLNLDERGQAWHVSYTPDCKVPDADPIPLADALARARL
ncbi:hypothetical protein AB0B10_26000 [Micromonospora arborensis]|uniref:hypothetical protein n=1 Tax=Micromonospora arborensis TaxID=2116518 RepID=UPI0033F0A179